VQWPLKAGYPGLAIKNLNEYVSLFSHCLVNIENYQGIEIIGIQSPVYITRFDLASLPDCDDSSDSFEESEDYETFRFFFGKIPSKSERNCSIDYSQAIKYTNKSINARWTCSAQFDLFFPEPEDAPLFVDYYSNRFEKQNLFDTTPQEYSGQAWSKII